MTQKLFLGQKNLRKILDKFQVRVRVSFGCQKFQTYLNVNKKLISVLGLMSGEGLTKNTFNGNQRFLKNVFSQRKAADSHKKQYNHKIFWLISIIYADYGIILI